MKLQHKGNGTLPQNSGVDVDDGWQQCSFIDPKAAFTSKMSIWPLTATTKLRDTATSF